MRMTRSQFPRDMSLGQEASRIGIVFQKHCGGHVAIYTTEASVGLAVGAMFGNVELGEMRVAAYADPVLALQSACVFVWSSRPNQTTRHLYPKATRRFPIYHIAPNST